MNKKILEVFFVFIVLGIGFISAECTDSDGVNYYLKGKATINNMLNYNDACVYKLEETNVEFYVKVGDIFYNVLLSCSGDNCYVAEAGCSGNEQNYINERSWEVFKCPNGCNDGACLKEPTSVECQTDAECIKSCSCIAGETCRCSEAKCVNGKCVLQNICSPKFVCKGGYEPKCKLVGGECVCETCPPETLPPPIDVTNMDYCLNDPNNYWDQETNGCYVEFSKEIIRYKCSDPDGGRNYFQYAHTFGFRANYADERDKRIRTGGADSCISDNQLVEHYCDENGFIQTEYTNCANGCKEGACIKGEQISEKITCKFEDTKKEQKCYLAGQWSSDDEGTKFCIADADSASCVILYTGYSGEKITWKSTCGQYQYTIQDGNDEVIYFKCKGGETTTDKIENKGFRYAYWQCYDGFENKAGDGSSCYPSENFAAKAKDDCQGHCKGEKCGVNSFAVNGECYTDEIAASEIFSQEGVVIKPTEPVLTSESSLVCKDSCPLDGKCYPFGYRKSGKYCSDSGAFTEQLKSDSTCDNNFECSSNVCVSGKCIDEGFLNKIINWFKRLFGG